MSAEFDPYHAWLGIPKNEQPANYYRLLGLPLFESNDYVISIAANRQMAYVRTFQTGQYSHQSQQILNELALARMTLLNKQKKAEYDAKLREEQKSGSNGGIGIASSLDSYGEIPSVPPPPAASLTSPPWSNNTQMVDPGVQSHVTHPGGSMPVPPIPDSPNRTVFFLKMHWITILIVLVVIQLLICGGVMLTSLLKPVKTEVVQNAPVEQPQKVVDGTKDDSQPSEAAQLAKRYYEQSVDLQEKENYDEALNKINVAVELQPENELYKAQQRALVLLIKSLGKAIAPQVPALDEEQPEQPEQSEKPEQPQGVESGKEAGERKTIVVNGVEFTFRWCPPGTFKMGSPESELDRDLNEKQHNVTLTKGFWIMETEVTQKQWKAVMDNNPSKFKDDGLPVENVSWNDCQDFCKKCTKLGLPVQLPTEAQWEYACRAGTTGAYAGNLDEMAWYNDGFNSTHPVGTKKPNAWGLYDMHGNVWEWCQDWYKNYLSESVTDPAGPSSGDYRINRGGNWSFNAKSCRSADRYYNSPENRNSLLGFRCVSSIDLEPSKTEDVKSAEENNDKVIIVPVNASVVKNAGKRAVKVINGVEFAFRWCPPGTFMMGSPTSEEGRNSKRETQHSITLTKGFWMMETEVTQKQWEVVMGNLPVCKYMGDDLPVEEVSWYESKSFCEKCTQLGLPVQLPTEAQWEYACRAGTTGSYAGNLDDMVWYCDNSNKTTHPVGTKKPNSWGLYDMHGNVQEWCQDCLEFKADYPGLTVYPIDNATDPTGGPSTGFWRIYRGGGWNRSAQDCRSACRYHNELNYHNENIGFRCIISH